ncbi:unnamed protein product, partial [Closterium sp. Naga37s-1]
VTSLKDQKQYWRPAQPHRYHYVSVRAFEEAFRASRFGKQMEAELSMPFKKDRGTVTGGNEGKVVDVNDNGEGEGKDMENGEEEGKGGREDGSASLALADRRFALPPLALLSVVANREWLLMRRNLFLYIVQTMQILPLAIVTMTVFWRSQFSVTPVDSNFYLGAIFFGISTMLFSGIIELTLLTARLPIYFLQRDNLLFPAWAWCVPMALLSLPVSLWSAGVWTAITYYGIGFAPQFSRFIAQLLLFFITHMSASALYRAMGAIFRSTTLINTLGNFVLVLLFLLSGFLITKDDIHSVWVWVYWISPLTYSQNAFAINEFLAPRWDVEFVEEVMDLVELEPVKGALVGTAGQDGLSVEQRKRLTMAVELVANPAIIFMDEPTSGLDARAAAIVMRAVRNTVNTGRTVVCTIHQPSIDIFEAFDELLLMQRGGEVIYTGSMGKQSCDLVSYFKAIPGVPPIQPGANPAAWMLEVTAPAAAERLGVDFAQIFRQSDQFRVIESLIQESSEPPEGEPDLFFPTQHPTTPLSQFATHVWKRHLMYWRMPDYNGARFFFSFFMALLIGGVFFGFGNSRDTPQQIVNVMGALYTAALFLGWSNLKSIQPMLAVERSIYYRERGAGMYGAIPYALAQGAIELPYLVVQAVVYSLITYAMIRFEWTLGKFLLYLLFQFLTLLYFTCFGMMTSAITPAEGLGTLLSAFIYSFWNLLCGFLLPQPVSAVLVAICF